MRRKGTTAVFLPYYLILMGDNIEVFHQTLLFLFWTFLRVEYWSNARFWKVYINRVVYHIQRTIQCFFHDNVLTEVAQTNIRNT